MTLPLLNIKKNWFKGTAILEANWDAIKDAIESWASNLNLGLDQIGFDVFGSSYALNTDGIGTLPKDVSAQIESVKNYETQIGPTRLGNVQNVGFESFQTSDPNDSIRLVGANGQALSPSNKIRLMARSLAAVGKLEIRSIENSLSLKLTGAHWGLNTHGNLSGGVIEIGFIDDGGSVPALAACMMPGRIVISNTLCFTTHASVNAPDRVLVNRSIAPGNHFYYPIGWVRANYVDSVSSSSIGPVSASGAFNNSGIGSSPWLNPNNVTVNDGSYAEPNLFVGSGTSYYLVTFNFSFPGLPGNAIIRGLEFRVRKREFNNSDPITDNAVRLVKNGVIGSTDRSNINEWPNGTFQYITYGGSTDLWGQTLSPSDNIAFAISAKAQSSAVFLANIDHIDAKIYYDLGQSTSWSITGLYPGQSSHGIVRPWSQVTDDFDINLKPSNGSFLWTIFGNLVFLDYYFATDGTSINTTYNLTIPVKSNYAVDKFVAGWIPNAADVALARINGSNLEFWKTLQSLAWGASGGKNCKAEIFYFGADS